MYDSREHRAQDVSPLPREILENSFHIAGDMAVTSGGEVHTLRLSGATEGRARGTHDQNNGVVAFITGEGELRVAPYTRALSEALDAAGYARGGLFVPFSNGERPAAPEQAAAWERIVHRSKAIFTAEREKAALDTFEAEAATIGIKHGIAERINALSVDKVRYQAVVDGPVRSLPGRFDNSAARAEIVGHFSSNNGLIGFVDETGRLYVASLSRANIELLESHGYREGGVWVPFSNGERPVEDRDLARLRALRDTPYA